MRFSDGRGSDLARLRGQNALHFLWEIASLTSSSESSRQLGGPTYVLRREIFWNVEGFGNMHKLYSSSVKVNFSFQHYMSKYTKSDPQKVTILLRH